MKYIKGIFIISTFLCLSVSNGQTAIKRLILEDLLLMNSMYDSCIFQKSQEFMIIDGDDTQLHTKTIDSVNFLTDLIIINKIDTVGSYLFITASISILANNNISGLFRNKHFEYIIKKEENRLHKINGFLFSEILLCDLQNIHDDKYLCKHLKINYRHLQSGNIKKISKGFTIAIFRNTRRHHFISGSNSHIITRMCNSYLY